MILRQPRCIILKISSPLCDSFLILDNEEEPLVIAKGIINQKIEIMNEVKWNLINSTNE